MSAGRPSRFRAVAAAALSALAVAGLGGSLTDLGPWYQALIKPSWQPPGWAFGVIWTVIFALAAASGVAAWRTGSRPATREWVIGLFALNGFLNVLWTLLFFHLHRPDWSLAEVPELWLSVALPMAVFWRLSRAASLLLLPYLVWVTIAAALNFEIVRLNAPFH